MLKFRLPWNAGSTEYLAGEIYLPVWGPITTTEARLIVRGHETRMYDNRKYEEQLFFFNTTTRVALYEHSVRGQGIDHCYDCRAEIDILDKFLRRFPRFRRPEESVESAIARLSADMSPACATGRTLASPNSDPEERAQGIRSRQWINGMPAYEHAKRVRIESHERPSEPVISETARSMMKVMGHEEGQGLGRERQGISEPVAAHIHEGRRGLGFSTYDGMAQLWPESTAPADAASGADSEAKLTAEGTTAVDAVEFPETRKQTGEESVMVAASSDESTLPAASNLTRSSDSGTVNESADGLVASVPCSGAAHNSASEAITMTSESSGDAT
jgi:hypothetical protein